MEAKSEGQSHCADLLKAMELVDSADEDTDSLIDTVEGEEGDMEMLGLPKEWIANLCEDNFGDGSGQLLGDYQDKSSEGLKPASEEMVEDSYTQPDDILVESLKPQMENITKTRTKKNKSQEWGPLMPQRKSKRFVEDGRTMLEKAQENKKEYNLDGGHEIRVDGYGYTLSPASQDFAKLGNSLSGGEEGESAFNCCYYQDRSFPSAVAGVEEKLKDPRSAYWEVQDLDQGVMS